MTFETLELQYSEADSLRFGLNIHRVPLMHEIDVPKIMRHILDNDVDTAMIRIPSNKLKDLHLLDRTGMPYMIADTLAYYHFDLLKQEIKPLANDDLTFSIATPDDHEVLNKLVRESYGDYINHYRVSYLFDNECVTEGYQDWVRSYAEGDSNRVCILVKKNGEPAGFGTFNFQREGKIKGILYAVRPKFRGNGILKDLLRYIQKYAKEERACEFMRTTIQIENIFVQKLWAQEGFQLHHTVNTVHVNALLTKSIFDPFSYDITIESEEQTSPKVSNRYVLQRINHEFDHKQNIVTRNHRFVNISPLKSGSKYTLKFSYPTASKGLLRILDQDHNTYLLVYFDLKHFVA